MTQISDAVAVPERENAVRSSARPHRNGRVGLNDWLALWSALEPWRVVLPAAFVALWIGFSVVPYVHPAFRVPTTLALAALIGVGTELCARSSGRPGLGRMAGGTLWIVPSGATIVIIMLVMALGPRPSIATPLLAGVVVAMMVLQAVEMGGLGALESWSRPINTGLAFALAFAAFAFTPLLTPAVAALVYAVAAGLVMLVVLRGCRGSLWDVTVYVVIAMSLIMQLGLMVHDARPQAFAAGIPVLGLYAISTTSHAVLDRAPRRAYVEVALVTLAVLAAAAFNLGHR